MQSHSGCTRTESLAGAKKKVIRSSRKVVESSSKGAELGAEPSDPGPGFVV
jgi:hypothetical protein